MCSTPWEDKRKAKGFRIRKTSLESCPRWDPAWNPYCKRDILEGPQRPESPSQSPHSPCQPWGTPKINTLVSTTMNLSSATWHFEAVSQGLGCSQAAVSKCHVTFYTEQALQTASLNTQGRLRVRYTPGKTEEVVAWAANGQQGTQDDQGGYCPPPSYEQKLLEGSGGFI